MKRNNKKGFTIVELVIVIAVIAILSAVLIPTFGSVINDANAVAAKQEARNGYLAKYAEDIKDGQQDGKNTAPATDVTLTDDNYKSVKIGEANVYVFVTDGYAFDGQNYYTVSGDTYSKAE